MVFLTILCSCYASGEFMYEIKGLCSNLQLTEEEEVIINVLDGVMKKSNIRVREVSLAKFVLIDW